MHLLTLFIVYWYVEKREREKGGGGCASYTGIVFLLSCINYVVSAFVLRRLRTPPPPPKKNIYPKDSDL